MNTWILLRGLSRESGHWGDFMPQFRQAFAKSRVLTLDFPGNGALYAQRSPHSVRAMLEHCRMQLSQAGLAPPYDILALSMGAMVAVAWAQHYPQEVTRLVLINTSLRPINPFYQRLRPANYLPLLRLMLSRTSPNDWEQALWQITSRMSPPQTVEGWLALRLSHPVSRLNVLRQLWAASRFTAPNALTGIPVLLLASTQDDLVAVECSRAIAQRWQWPLVEHPQAGHDLPLDDGPWVVQQVLAWTATTALRL